MYVALCCHALVHGIGPFYHFLFLCLFSSFFVSERRSSSIGDYVDSLVISLYYYVINTEFK